MLAGRSARGWSGLGAAMKLLKLVAFAAAGLCLAASPAAAATLILDGTTLTGANGVIVNGTDYDVTFVEGTCSTLFDGCDSASDFAFTNATDAMAAAQALLGQVLLDTGQGQFDSDYTLTFGCAANSDNACFIVIPYSIFDFAYAANTATTDTTFLAGNPVIDTNLAPQLVYARFTPAAAVPEPGSWALMLIGFVGLGVAVRRRGRAGRGTGGAWRNPAVAG